MAAMTVGFVLIAIGFVLLFVRWRTQGHFSTAVGAPNVSATSESGTNRVWSTAAAIILFLLGIVLIIIGA